MEIGASLGTMSYLGDFNSNVFGQVEPSFGVTLRRVINPYMGLRAELIYGKLKGDSRDEDTYYPDYETEPKSFSTTLWDFNITYEYNFWPYGTGRDYRGAKRTTPFVFLGLGGTFAKVDQGESATTLSVPLGLGIKHKISKRLNVSLSWQIDFTLSDKLDGVEDPYYVKSSGMFKNADAYSSLRLALTYSFSPKCRTCNKDD